MKLWKVILTVLLVGLVLWFLVFKVLGDKIKGGLSLLSGAGIMGAITKPAADALGKVKDTVTGAVSGLGAAVSSLFSGPQAQASWLRSTARATKVVRGKAVSSKVEVPYVARRGL